jgi:hypothetical protein
MVLQTSVTKNLGWPGRSGRQSRQTTGGKPYNPPHTPPEPLHGPEPLQRQTLSTRPQPGQHVDLCDGCCGLFRDEG